MDSSLILLAIIALSGAYLMPHAVRRREQLSAARATDRFSSAMRVLARRPHAGARSQVTAHSRPATPALLSSPRLAAPRSQESAGSSAATTPPRPQGRSRRSRTSRSSRWSACLLLVTSVLLATTGSAAVAVGATSDLGPRLGVQVAPLWWAVAAVAQLAVVLVVLRLRARRRAVRRRAVRRLVAVRLVPAPNGAQVAIVRAAPPAAVDTPLPAAAAATDDPALVLRPA